MANRGLWTLAWTLITSAVVVLYLLPNAGPPEAYQIDKLCHLTAFAAIGFPLRFVARARSTYRRLIGLGVALAASLELIQSGVPGRVFSFADIAANEIGFCMGLIVAASVASALAVHAADSGS